MLLTWVILLPLSLASICPLKGHQVCNIRNEEYFHEDNKHQCTCAVTVASKDRPAPEQSCTNLIKRDDDGSFPVVSLAFNLKESPDMDEFPEESFRDTISGALRVDPADILLLRVNCQGTDDTLTVQFAVLKKEVEKVRKQTKVKKIVTKEDDDGDDEDDDVDEDDQEDKKKDDGGKGDNGKDDEDDDGDDDDDDAVTEKGGKKNSKNNDADDSDGNDDDDDEDEDDDDDDEFVKYDKKMFVDAESVATRMKAMGHLSQIADLQLDTIEYTEDLIALEYEPDNSTLFIQAVVAAVSVVLMMALGIWATCRKNGYQDDLQKV